ncbi:prepilin-type N-terminal cleavage/methylation domain-containing protein [bacterium AH-315-F18]|nr:prepilin-type N-terminal cleavage/methylation domain-containing protein [bacterium AH-315-F18]
MMKHAGNMSRLRHRPGQGDRRGFSLMELMFAMTLLTVGLFSAVTALGQSTLGSIKMEQVALMAAERQKAYLIMREELVQAVIPVPGSVHFSISSDPANAVFPQGDPLEGQFLNNVLKFHRVQGRNSLSMPRIFPPQPAGGGNFITYRIDASIGIRQLVREVDINNDNDIEDAFAGDVPTVFVYGDLTVNETMPVQDSERLVLCNYAKSVRFTEKNGVIFIDLVTAREGPDGFESSRFPLAIRPRNPDF